MRKLVSFLLAMVIVMSYTLAGAQTPAVEGDVVVLNIFEESTRPMNAQTEMIRQYAVDNLKVDIQMHQVAENYNQQLALMMTTGDIPDLMWIDYNTYLEYAKQGAFADLTDYVGNYGSLMGYVGEYWDPMKVDDKIYGVPTVLKVPTSVVTAIRKDWLDNLNLSIPKTLDEYTQVLRAFTNNDPDKNGKNDTYGLCGSDFMYLSPFFGAFGATSEQHYFLNEDDTITTNVISDGYRKGLEYLHGLYAEGVIDPEFFTATTSQVTEKWCRGEFGVWPGWWSQSGNAVLRYGFNELQPTADVQIIPPPTGENGLQGCAYAEPFSYVLAMSHKATPEKINAAMRLIDFQTTDYGFYVFCFGLENVGFELDDAGKIKWYYAQDGKDRLGNEVTDMEVYKLVYREELMRYADSLSDNLSSRIYWKATQIQYATPSRANLFAYTKTKEYIEYNAELTKFLTENSIRFIMGDKDIETEWDQFKASYLDMGGETVRQSMLKAYNEKMGKNYTFAE